jgi:sigma-B regulation protein RsbU (phosphoserine phosphatase)
MQDANSPTGPRVLNLLRERLPTGLAGAAFWLGLWFCALFSRHLYSGGFRAFLGILQVFVGIALVSVAIPLAWQLIRKHLLWSLRNKLILTYILIGLAPVILFLTLVGVLAYVAAGPTPGYRLS